MVVKMESKISDLGRRLILRNMPFQATSEKIEKFFKPFDLLEINMLTKQNKFKGVVFIQLSSAEEASKLMKEYNGKKMMDRNIVIDIAIPKKIFLQKDQLSVSTIKEEDDTKDTSILNEVSESNIPFIDNIKEEPDDSSQSLSDLKNEPCDSTTSETNDDIKDESSSDDENNGNSDIKDVESKFKSNEVQVPKKKFTKKDYKNIASQDVAEGRTVFVRRLGSTANEGDLKEKLQKFGKIKKVKMCVDSRSKEFKGSAFVEFEKLSGAEACLEAVEDPLYKAYFTLQMRTFEVMKAVARKNVPIKSENIEGANLPKDKRNIYLAREGVIRGGTLAAQGISKHDLRARNDREVIKRRLLKNLHVFVSKTRLCVHNLPENLTDAELRKIFRKRSPKDAIITEARVMKPKEPTTSDETKNLGYGFVTFETHEHALAALRKVNNNPEVFKRDKRPIVEFSLENRAALNAREARLKKSQENNKRILNEDDEPENSEQPKKKIKINIVAPNFAGYKSKKGISLSSHIGPKERHGKKKENSKSKSDVDLKPVFSSDSIRQAKSITRNKINNKFRKQRKHRSDMQNKEKKLASKSKGKKNKSKR